ncbi:MAG: hypothetical protein V1731_01370 [Candidatus Aenigmatarchaeota archaeon]
MDADVDNYMQVRVTLSQEEMKTIEAGGRVSCVAYEAWRERMVTPFEAYKSVGDRLKVDAITRKNGGIKKYEIGLCDNAIKNVMEGRFSGGGPCWPENTKTRAYLRYIMISLDSVF